MATATLEAPVAPAPAATFTPTPDNPICLTARAATEVRDILEQQGNPEGIRLRIYVAGGGCSGLQYGMALDENVDEGDAFFPAYVQQGDLVGEELTNVRYETDNGFEVVIDPMSLRYIVGSVVDYVTTPMGGGFKVENPNAVKSCGCGSSFNTDEDAGTVTGGCGSCCSSN
jgi:iron-sulfur cluster assembly protein